MGETSTQAACERIMQTGFYSLTAIRNLQTKQQKKIVGRVAPCTYYVRTTFAVYGRGAACFPAPPSSFVHDGERASEFVRSEERRGQKRKGKTNCPNVFFFAAASLHNECFYDPPLPRLWTELNTSVWKKKRNRYLRKKLPAKGPNNGNERTILDSYNSIRGFNYPYYSPSLFLHLSRSANHPPRRQQQGKRRSQTVVKRAPLPSLPPPTTIQ